VRKPAARDLSPLVPTSVNGWQARDAGRQLGPETIFEALNGGAEVYLDFGFVRMLLREYDRPHHPRITIYLFDMGRPAEAYGIFSHEREGRPVDVGAGADLGEGLLRFWKGRYFASLFAARETTAAREALLALAREVAGRIPSGGRPDPLVDLLPPEGQQGGPPRFVHTAPTLDHHVRLGPGNPLGLSRDTDVALADYGAGPDRLQALIVRHGAAAPVDAALRALAAMDGAASRVTGRGCGALLLVAAGGAGADERRALLARVAARVKDCAGDPGARGGR
jgi:hypothetical protein